MKYSFPFKKSHHCEAVVLCCIDFRFINQTEEFVEKELGIKAFDLDALPGAAKAINDSAGDEDIAIKAIQVPCELHGVKKIIIVNHQDCGAYGGSAKFEGDAAAEQKFHEEELKKAGEKIIQKFPGHEITLLYAKLVDSAQNIEFIKIS